MGTSFSRPHLAWIGPAAFVTGVLAVTTLSVNPSNFDASVQQEPCHAYIVQSYSTLAAQAAVESVGGRVTGELRIIDGVSASLTEVQVAELRKRADVHQVFADIPMKIAGIKVGRITGPANDTQPVAVIFNLRRFISADTTIRFVARMNTTSSDHDVVQIDNLEIVYDSVYATGTSYPSLAGADELHEQGITGKRVTVAVLDTGYWHHPDLDTNSLGAGRVLAHTTP